VLTWTVGGQPIEIAAGQALCIPRGAIHRFDNLGSQPAKVLCVITPAAIGPQYFRDVAEVMKAAAGGPPDKARMGDVMRRHGLPNPYEQLKALTRGQGIDARSMRDFVASLGLPEDAKQRLLAMTPASYTGLAERLARDA